RILFDQIPGIFNYTVRAYKLSSYPGAEYEFVGVFYFNSNDGTAFLTNTELLEPGFTYKLFLGRPCLQYSGPDGGFSDPFYYSISTVLASATVELDTGGVISGTKTTVTVTSILDVAVQFTVAFRVVGADPESDILRYVNIPAESLSNFTIDGTPDGDLDIDAETVRIINITPNPAVDKLILT